MSEPKQVSSLTAIESDKKSNTGLLKRLWCDVGTSLAGFISRHCTPQDIVDMAPSLDATKLTGTLTDAHANTQAVGTNDATLANTAFVKAALDAFQAMLVSGAPGTLDTFAELAAQMAADESAAAALVTTVSGKVPATRTVAGKALSANITLAPTDLTGVSANGASLIGMTYAAMKTALSVVVGTDFNAYRAELDKLGLMGADLASTTNMDLGAATGQIVQITGTNTIASFGTVTAGTYRILRFTGSLTLTHNATSLITLAGASLSIAAGETLGVVSLGSGNWRVLWHQRLESAKIGVQASVLTAAATTDIGSATGDMIYVNGTTTITALGNAPLGARRHVQFNASLSLVNNSAITIPTGTSWVTLAGDIVEFVSIGASQWRVVSIRRGGELEKWLSVQSGVASAQTVNLATTLSAAVIIGGTTQIESFGAGIAGTLRYLTFTSTPKLYYSGNIRVPGGASINVEAGDTCMVMCEGGTSWRVFNYQRATGKALVETGVSGGGRILTGEGALFGYTDGGDPGSAGSYGSSYLDFSGWPASDPINGTGTIVIANENASVTFTISEADPSDGTEWLEFGAYDMDSICYEINARLVASYPAIVIASFDGAHRIDFRTPDQSSSSVTSVTSSTTYIPTTSGNGSDEIAGRPPSGEQTFVNVITPAAGKSLRPTRVGIITNSFNGTIVLRLYDPTSGASQYICEPIPLSGERFMEIGDSNASGDGFIRGNYYSAWINNFSDKFVLQASFADDPAANVGLSVTIWAQCWEYTP